MFLLIAGVHEIHRALELRTPVPRTVNSAPCAPCAPCATVVTAAVPGGFGGGGGACGFIVGRRPTFLLAKTTYRVFGNRRDALAPCSA
jgi:hypothetical protein